MKYLLDSDALTALGDPQNEDYKTITSFLSDLGEDAAFYISMLTVYEMEYGIAAFTTEEGKQKTRIAVESFKRNLPTINLSFEDAQIYGELKQGYKEKTGINKNALKRHNIDIALASISIANNCTLIGTDSIYSDHLQKIKTDFKFKNWRT